MRAPRPLAPLVATLLVTALGACAVSGRAASAGPATTPAVVQPTPPSAIDRPRPVAAPASIEPDAGAPTLACVLTREPVEASCDGGPCLLQRSTRIACANTGLVSFAAHDARRAALLVLERGAWFVDLDPGSAQPVRHLHDDGLVWGHLVTGPAGGYRLVATDLNRRAVVSSVIPAGGGEPPRAELETLDTALPMIVAGAATTADGRALAWVGHRHDATPLRRLEQGVDGGWRSTEAFPRVWGQPLVAANAPGAYGLLFFDARASAQPSALYALLRDDPARALAPYRVQGATQLALAADGGAAWLLDDAAGVARLSVLGSRVVEAATLPGATAAPPACAPPPGTRPDANTYACTLRGEERSPLALAPAPDGALWALQVVRQVEVDQRVRRHFMPVDPTQGMTRVPPPHVEEQRQSVADRSTGALVVYRVARMGTRWAVEARARLAVPELEGLTAAPAPLVVAREGVLHVLVQAPKKTPGLLRHLVLDTTQLAR